jgi:transcriptional regulator with XRE-family HTH domain
VHVLENGDLGRAPAQSRRLQEHAVARAAALTKTAHRPHPIDQKVGEALRRVREARGWRQADLAERIGVTYQQVQKYESGETRLSASVLVAASRALGAPVEQFFAALPDPSARSPKARAGGARPADLLALEEGRDLVLALAVLPIDQRRAVLDLLRTLAPKRPRDGQAPEAPSSVRR